MEYLIVTPTRGNKHVEIAEIFARYYNIKGTKNADNGKIKEALKEFTKAIDLYPAFTPAYFNRATIKADLGDFEGARADFQKARDLEKEISSVIGMVNNPYTDFRNNEYH